MKFFFLSSNFNAVSRRFESIRRFRTLSSRRESLEKFNRHQATRTPAYASSSRLREMKGRVFLGPFAALAVLQISAI